MKMQTLPPTAPVLSGYRFLECIWQGEQSDIHRAERLADNLQVIVKVPSRRAGPRAAARLRREQAIAKALKGVPSARRIIELRTIAGGPALVCADVRGSSLHSLIGGGLEPRRFLELAIAITGAVEQIHRHQVVHKDLKPQNIMIDEATGSATLIDFGIASQLPREEPEARSAQMLEGSLPYMSPEQTGRMNRVLDLRTDLYSLGVTFYEMLTGRLPFTGNDPLEWIHCHLAHVPAPPHEVAPAVPAQLSAVVMKLLAKTGEERYQSAVGLRADLERCRDELDAHGRIAPFPVGTREESGIFRVPQRLYGREAEIERLMDAFSQTVQTGEPRMVLVAGWSGIGKSSLVHELHRPIVARRGFFASGKFDQLQRDVPYGTLIQALLALVQNLLAEPDLEPWRQRLLAALGTNGRVVAEVIPEIELIVGKQPPVAALGPAEARNRFSRVFGAFLQAFADRDHPLVLFLDDMQWADPATYDLVISLLTDSDIHHVFFILAYRDNEVDAAHPFSLCLDRLRRAGPPLTEITLGDLDVSAVTQLLADTLGAAPARCAALAALVHRQTGGNPFFVLELLHRLHRDALVRHDGSCWTWDTEGLAAHGYTANVVELLSKRIALLEPEARRVLGLAASLGNTFALDVLALADGRDPVTTAEALWPSIREGLLVPPPGYHRGDTPAPEALFRFQHDRIQQAAYLLIDPEHRPATHLRIGRLLLAGTPPERLDARIFAIVNHLVAGVGLIDGAGERRRLLELELRAGRKAKAAAAYRTALDHIDAALSLLPADAWTMAYELTLSCHREHAELAYLCGDFEDAEAGIQASLQHAASALDRADLLSLLVILRMMDGRGLDAIRAGRQALRELEIVLPEEDLAGAAAAVDREVRALLGDRPLRDLAELPELTDPAGRLAIRILANLCPAAYVAQHDLFPLLVVTGMRLCLDRGMVAEAPKIIGDYGTLRSGQHGEFQAGFELGAVALALGDRFGVPSEQGKACWICAAYTTHGWRPLREAIPHAERGFVLAYDSGDYQFAGFIAYLRLAIPFYAGEPLPSIAAELPALASFCSRVGNRWARATIEALSRAIAELTGKAPQPLSRDEAAFLDECRAANPQARFFDCGFRALCLLLEERSAEALAVLQQVASCESACTGFYAVADHALLRALSALGSQGERGEPIAAPDIARLRTWAAVCPDNFHHQRLLVEAELARAAGRSWEAAGLYERAALAASGHGFVQHAAVAHLRAASLFRERDQGTAAEAHLLAARDACARWGATAVVRRLEEAAPTLMQTATLVSRRSDTSSTSYDRAMDLDALTVVKAQQAISRVLVLDELLRTLMRIAVENAGAQRGVLLFVRGGELMVEAESEPDAVVIARRPLSEITLPKTLLAYVRRTHETVIVDGADRLGRFAHDPYFSQGRPHSALCVPIRRSAELTGLLYLENAVVPGVFTRSRLALVEQIAAQAAISLENATLYEELAQRTRELEEMHQRLLETAHQAGMAEIASGVLHNVGNALATVTLAVSMMDERLTRFPAEQVRKSAALFLANRTRLADFLANDARGQILPEYLDKLGEKLERERAELVSDFRTICSNLDQIKVIVSAQHAHAGGPRFIERVDLGRLIQDAVRMHIAGLERDGVIIEHELAALPPLPMERHKVLQILVNLISNAKQSLARSEARSKQLTIRVTQPSPERVVVAVSDTGLGITAENLPRIFQHGFTTRADSHGFGLHWAANAARAMGGALTATSQGAGHGATFTLEVPIATPEIAS